MTSEARTILSTRKKTIPPTIRPSGTGNHVDTESLQHYQSALQLLQQAKFDKALVAFEKLLGTAPPPLAERCRIYVSACHRELSKTALEFVTLEEQYDYAVSLLNMDYYEEAREQFVDILSKNANADYALYGLAVLDAITGQIEECLEHLSRSIETNPRNRLQARTDSDFQNVQDDPRFTELLYPENP